MFGPRFDSTIQTMKGPFSPPLLGSVPSFLYLSGILKDPAYPFVYWTQSVPSIEKFVKISMGIFKPQLMILVKDPNLCIEILSHPDVYVKGPGYDVRTISYCHLYLSYYIYINYINLIIIFTNK